MKKNENQVNDREDDTSNEISFLLNSIYYFIETVFIKTVKGGYQLIVIHHQRLLTDEIYQTVRGAKIAFLKLHGNKAWQEGVNAMWSKFYSPLPDWQSKKLHGNKTKTNKEEQ